MQKILVIQTAFLGDVILATPVISELKRLFPQAKIDFLVKKGNESLLENHKDLNQVFVFNNSKGKYKQMFKLSKQFRKNKYDLIINLHRFASSGLITLLSGAKKTFGFKKNPLSVFYSKRFTHLIGNGQHEVERNLSLIKEFGAQSLIRPSLYPSQTDFDTVQAFCDEGFVIFAPASVWFTKQLPAEKWIELASKTNQKIILIGAPGDFDLCEKIAVEIKENNITKNVVNTAGKFTLMQSAALISKATMAYVNDSGPLHMASAVNTPTTAYFCSTVPEFGFFPLADKSIVKQTELKLECKPCGLHGYKACPLGHFNCSIIEV